MSISLPLIVTAILIIWLIVLTFFLVRLLLHYQSLTGTTNKKDLIGSLNNLISLTKTNREETDKLKKTLETEIANNKAHLQKLGFKRFNPFTDTGGDQSFALSLLDENNNGVVISSLHSRESTRIYAKRILAGKSANQVLSKEETEVIKNEN